VAIAEFVSVRERRVAFAVLAIMAGLPPEARDELLRRFLEEVDAMDLPEERIAKLVEDVQDFIGYIEEVSIEPDEAGATPSYSVLRFCVASPLVGDAGIARAPPTRDGATSATQKRSLL